MAAYEIIPGRDLKEIDTGIVRLRTARPGITYEEMAEELHDTPGHIASRVRKLIKLGEIESRGGPGFRPKRGE